MTDDTSHERRIALVTGANKGIGRAVAEQLDALGMTVLAAARDPELGEEAAGAMRAAGLDVHPVVLDVTDPDAVRRVFETNVFGVITVTNALLPLLLRSPAPRVVNVSSHVGSLTTMSDPGHRFALLPGSAAYPPSKTALNALTVQYAKDLRETSVKVNAVAPGACATDFITRLTGLPCSVDRTAGRGAAIAVRLATVGDDGPTCGYFDDDGPVPW